MKRNIGLLGLIVMCCTIFMVSACEIGESPMELARKQKEPKKDVPVQRAEPLETEQPPVEEQAVPTEAVQPDEIAKPAERKPPSAESLEQVKSWALVDGDTGDLRVAPDANAKVAEKLPFATVLLVFEKEASWYKVTLTDQKTWGWIAEGEVHESNMSPDHFELDDLANFYYAASTTMKGKDKKIRLLNLLIEQYPQAKIYFTDPDTRMIIQGDAKELALFALADIYKANREYQKATEAYGTIIDESKRTDVKGYAGWNLLKIYETNLRNAQKTIDESLHIIESYKELGISGFEWNIWVDIEAAQALRDTLMSNGSTGSDMVSYGRKVMAANDFPPVQVIGSMIIAEGFMKQNDTASMENTVLNVLRKHPTASVQYFKRKEDYSTEALSLAIKYYIEKLHDYEAALAFSEKVVAGTSNKTLADNAKFAIAYISDIWLFGRDEVIAAYLECGDVKNFLYVKAFPSSNARLQAIQGFEPFGGTVMPDVGSLHLEPDSSSPVVRSVSKGDKVTALYGNPPNFQGTWLKVKTLDNRFGWVQENVLEETNPTTPGDEATQ